tara:strand:+ start:396 stop:662 length:267 start_codon:yes stop_codon:yes gene_type:complete
VDLSDYQFIVYMSVKNDKGKLEDIPLRPFLYEHDAKSYITGYSDAIVNHTGEANEAKVRGQFSIRDVAGLVVNNNEDDSSTNKETENV